MTDATPPRRPMDEYDTDYTKDTEKTVAIWSDNLVSLYHGEVAKLRGSLEYAIKYLDSGQLASMDKCLADATSARRTMDKCLESANLTVYRVQALAEEVKAIRRGCAVTHVGSDPAENIEQINSPFRKVSP